MALRSRVKFAKCQMLVTSFFVLLLSLAGASIVALTHFGDHFTVISRAPLERSPFQSLDRWVFAVGIVLAGLLGLGAALSAAATVREAQGLMAGGFLCFILVFLALAQVAFWRLRNPTQVEDAVLDTYDLVYDQAVRSPSGTQSQELTAIQDTFLCCGKTSPFGLLGSGEAALCQGPEAAREDCLQSIRNFLRTHATITSTLTGAGLALTVYAMLLSTFLWLAIHKGCGLDHKGGYSLTPRAHGYQYQEPSLFRRFQEAPVPRHPSEAEDVL
ncbi:PREDICTED: tetraspanin-32 isoform X1 [Dipodomys ordii]|uniref:Tetraspanin n=1 Tax=Dipodomys ordii TaxID=10020 RepID=A0A1S3FIM1_DIPOR|nr:PREDICTED: tetraspanin-32 isoform X1 [Dipodomys ordii]